MDDMRNLARQGLITDEYMRELEAAHKRDQSLEAFGRFIDEQRPTPAPAEYRGSGGNKKRLTRAARLKKRKAKKLARRRARA